MTPRTAGRWVAASLAALSLGFLPGPCLLRLCSDTLNCVFMAIATLCVPASLLALGLVAQSTWRMTMAILLGVLTALPLVPIGLICLLSANTADPADASFRRIAELQAEGRTYRLYLTDCGATCAFGLQLRREIEFLHVVKLVVPLWNKDPAPEDATLREAQAGDVEVVRGDSVLFTTRSLR